MLLSDFDFYLPPELIAQKPAERRDGSRLLVVDRASGMVTHRRFPDLRSLLRAGDLLVVNNARVIPARILGTKTTGGRAEIFLVRKHLAEGEVWVCLIKVSKPPKPGTVVLFPRGMSATVIDSDGDGLWIVEFSPAGSFAEWLDEEGRMPLPPYIRRAADEADKERYQTVFARVKGAVAAPTAGLHFTDTLLQELAAQGVGVASVTLHVGLGTFMPIRVDDPREHKIHVERYDIPPETVAAIAATRENGGRIVAVGTTTTRALEHAGAKGVIAAGEGVADNFIMPGGRFNVVDALITNFHLPKSTLLLLVSAFMGKELLLHAYETAVAERYRFYSYGDAMFVS